MSESIALVVPAGSRYRALAPEVAGKYAELVGGSAAEARALAATVSEAVARLQAADPETPIELTLTTDAGGIAIALRCGGRSAALKQPIPARKS